MAKAVRITLDSASVRALDTAVKQMPERVRAIMGPRMRKAMSIVQTRARQKPAKRYTSRTGALSRSVAASVLDSGLTGVVDLRDEIAEYGKYIHEGFKSWQPDPFLDNAAEASIKEIEEELAFGIEGVINELFG
jgi:hypothetical protein